jgi:hypothetical protein
VASVIDLDRPASRARRLPVLAVAALAAGVMGGLVASVARARVHEPAAPTREVRFATIGDAKVEYAALATTASVEQVASTAVHTVRVGVTVVLTVRSMPPTWSASCRILVDGAIVDEGYGGGGNSVTCVWTIA